MAVVTPKEFCMSVEENCTYHKMGIIDAVLDACEEFGIEIEAAGNFINMSIKERLAVEAHQRNLHKSNQIGNLDDFLG